MTKHKEVLELALDTHIKNESHRTVEESRYWCDQYKLLAQTAIKALAQPEQEPVALETVYETIIQWDEGGGKRSRRELARRIVSLYTHPPVPTAQPEQEPVAHMNQHGVIHEAGYPWEPTNRLEPLYTTPPQRKPLTDDEILDLWLARFDVEGSPINNFVRAIEAAHGIKGDA